MPLVTTNSCAISALIHAPDEDKEDGHVLPVQWGVIEQKAGCLGQCAFSTAVDIKLPVEKHEYQ